jgi:hypothetical protein
MGFIRLAAVSVVGAALAFVAPVAASAAPGTPSKTSPTTTTTAPSKNAQAFARLVIKGSSLGHVNVKAAGASTFKPAKNGQSLHVGDTVQTDATGQAEIAYADTAYTRLDINTTFTIKKLTDSQGNRQVEGSLDVGRTYNRTAALTQSQTFQQDGGGATAAVAGTTFVVSCTSASSCAFTAVDHITNLTGPNGTRTLNPLDQCDANNGALCGTTTRLTPDELALLQWIQTNVLLDLTEHGIGDGVFQPFAGTVTVNNGVVQSFTPSTPNQGFTPAPPANNPPNNPPPPQALVIDQTNPIILDPNTTQTPASSFGVEDQGESLDQNFAINASDPNPSPQPFNVKFTALPPALEGTICAPNSTTISPCPSGYAPVQPNQPYTSTTNFVYTTTGTAPETASNTSFTVQAVSTPTGGQPASQATPVTVNITETDG